MNINFSFGLNCKDNKTPLEVIGLKELFDKIVSAEEIALVNTTKNLRSVLKYSQERYRVMKTSLPFFSCSVFNPPFRSIHQFEAANGLIIDLDFHQPVDSDLLTKLKLDERVALGYISPSRMGLKLVFGFHQPVNKPENYTNFYKKFSYDFSNHYKLADVLDQKNCDVSRISFICHDPDAWMNDDFIPLDPDEMADQISIFEIPDEKENPPDISPVAYRQILAKLGSRPRPPKTVIPVMEEITEVMPMIEEDLLKYGISVKSCESIQHGAKLRLYRGQTEAELNLYWGKHGYKVVSSPRKGTDHELNEVSRHIVQGVLVRY